jgi:amino acid adenylation domain-containing protein
MQMHKTRAFVLPFVFTCGIDAGDVNQKNTEKNIFFDQEPVYSIAQTPQVFLDHIVREDNGHLNSVLIYVEGLFSSNMIIDMHHTFIELLQKLTLFDDMWYKPVSISLPPNQKDKLLNFNQTQWNSNIKEKLLHLLVIEQAEKISEAWAILSSRENLTYQQLMNRVYSLAYYLQKQRPQSNQLIAILMEKGWEQIVACLAILLVGAAYLPLDIDSPYDRLSQILEETNIKIILTQSHCHHTFPHLRTIPVDIFTYDRCLEPFPIKQQSSTDLAYVIYTSGSTGKPKGVMITHQAVLNTILDINSRLNILSDDRIFALSHLNFDLSVYDIFGILIAGGTIVIPDHEHYKNPQHWYDMMIKHHVTIWNSVPMLMQMLVEHLQHTNIDNQLRHVLLSGDWIPLSLPNTIRTTLGEQVTITSLGGATEASIWSIAFTLPKQIPQEWKSIPYGMPLRNQHYYVYDMHLDDCPEWVNGELYIGGVGLAVGYWNDREKTESSFIIHPHTGERLYRTGDHGRFIPDGYIEFMGRKDFQVKMHGHRIELGEIEYHLQQHEDIHQAIVTIDQNSQQLIGYVMPEKHSAHSDAYDQSEIEITDPIERTNFKLARHGMQHQHEVKGTYPLIRSELTEKLINTYYARKSYRQFTNEIIERSMIEDLLRSCYNRRNHDRISRSNVDLDILSQLLSVLTSINVSDQPLPKYRYASAGSLYPVQVYLELSTSINNFSSGLYYHNAEKHTLELVNACFSCENNNIRLHLVGRSKAITPLYGKKLGFEFCILETGYIMGLLEKEGSRLGLTFAEVNHHESTESILDLNENDTHYCFTISSSEQQQPSDGDSSNDTQCIVYLKTVQNNKHQWFIYDKENETVIPFDSGEETVKKEIPLFFNDDNDTKIIFHDCQGAIFVVNRSQHTLHVGRISHLLMDDCLNMNIGMCPIGTRISLPSKVNVTLDRILTHYKLTGNSYLLHTLVFGKISNKQKYERTISKVKSLPEWNEALRAYLSEKLPAQMIPSHFMTVSSFPLSSNGKIDRNSLPQISMSILENKETYIAPSTELEKIIENIWQQLLCTDRLASQHRNAESDQFSSTINDTISLTDDTASNDSFQDSRTYSRISTTTSFFDLGGDSLRLIQIYRQYHSLFNFDTEVLTIRPFFIQTTLAEHAKLLESFVINNMETEHWHILHLNEGKFLYCILRQIEIFHIYCNC